MFKRVSDGDPVCLLGELVNSLRDHFLCQKISGCTSVSELRQIKMPHETIRISETIQTTQELREPLGKEGERDRENRDDRVVCLTESQVHD